MTREQTILSLRSRVEYLAKYKGRRLLEHRREDLLQEAWVGAIRAVGQYCSSHGTTLVGYAAHSICGSMLEMLRREDHLTRGHRKCVRLGTAQDIKNVDLSYAKNAPTFDGVDDSAMAKITVDRLLSRVPISPIESRVLDAKYYEGKTNPEIARELGVSTGHVWQLHKQIITGLRTHL